MPYNIDYKTLVLLLLPTFLRRPKMIAWLIVLVLPIDALHYLFIQKRATDIYKLNHNGQVCYLRKALNDAFDPKNRRIKIIDGQRYTRLYIYTTPEQKPKFLKMLFLREETDFADSGVDFIVEMPSETYHKYNVEALIDFYKLASKRYKIELR